MLDEAPQNLVVDDHRSFVSTLFSSTAKDVRVRVALYRLLGHLYRRRPTRTLLLDLEKTGFPERMTAQGYVYGLPRAAEIDDRRIRALRREYARIFVGPKRHVPPYGSVHHPRDRWKGRLWGDTTKEVRAFAESHGLRMGRYRSDIPDHVGIELDVFSRLLGEEARLRATRSAEGVQRMLEAQRTFFNRHIGAWVPRFCEKAIKVAKNEPLYSGVLWMTHDFLESERRLYLPRRNRGRSNGRRHARGRA